MDTNRKIAVVVGALFIIGTVSGVLSAVFTGAILDGADLLNKVAANQNQVVLGALFVLVMGLSLAIIPMVIYPISKKVNQTLALGYVIFRGALEAAIYIAMVICWLLLIILSQEFAAAGAPDTPVYQTLGALLLNAGDQINLILKIVFSLGSLMFNTLLFRSKLVPRWLSAWGLIGVTLHLAEGLLGMFGLLPASAEAALWLPIAVQEMLFAVWLIVKGFTLSAIPSETTN